MPLAVAVISEKLGTYASRDTTKIADEALARGHTVHEVFPDAVSQVEGRLIAKARRYTGADAAHIQERIRVDLEDMDVIHFRPNPPVDMSYLTTLYLLDRIKDQVLVINDPESIIRFPEKIFPL
jgi:glutathione synthase